ncbi:MAG: hypothetical protein KJ634_00035 [Gammaproteobacteria bacterium]|nr:hypothetical protein [Gammaproteobacteria bacterium]MBU1413986.1 hypothetical protein [Gammaproteobacteria bacterium]
MDYELKIEQKAGYLHGIVTGQNCRETVAAYLAEGVRECTARGYSRVLIEARLQGPRLPLWDIFEIAAKNGRTVIGAFRAIAYVDVKAPAELLEFIGNVTSNRGLPLRVFNSVAAAEQWLAAPHEASAKGATVTP